MMIYAAADANSYIPIDNLSTAHKHYRTYINLCSTIKDTLETCCNRQTAADLQHMVLFTGTASPVSRLMHRDQMPAEPLTILARILYIPFDRTAIFGTAVQPYRTYNILPTG